MGAPAASSAETPARVTLPTFVIGGAPKAGTTALWAWLNLHPQVGMSRIKEPVFFTETANNPVPGVHKIGPPRAITYRRGIGWYERLFRGSEGCVARGDASPHYIGAMDGPELMLRHVQELKVVFLLRDPVARAYAHFWEYRKRGYRMQPFEAVLDDDPALRYLIYMSRYRQHLERYRAAFGTDRMRLYLFDDLRSDPESTFSDICRFIGVDPTFQPAFEIAHNPYAEPAIRTLHDVTTASKRFYPRLVPRFVRRPLSRLRDAIEGWNLRSTPYAPIDPQVRLRLIDVFDEDIAYVEQLTRPLPAWRQALATAPAP